MNYQLSIMIKFNVHLMYTKQWNENYCIFLHHLLSNTAVKKHMAIVHDGKKPIVHDERQKPFFKCGLIKPNFIICQQSFVTRADLKKHRETEHECPKCLICSNTFSQIGDMQKHIHKHCSCGAKVTQSRSSNTNFFCLWRAGTSAIQVSEMFKDF